MVKPVYPLTTSLRGYEKVHSICKPQVIKLTSCLPTIGGSPAFSTTKTGHHVIGEKRRIPFIFDDFHFCRSRVIGLDMTENRIFTLCRMIT
jgi:hypothetical protein